VDTFFLPFEQAEKQLSRSYEGAGLGLAISAGIVKMMGGVIDVESEPGKGSVFTVCVPAPRYTPPEEPSAPEQAEEGAAPDFSGKRILLAEDNEVNREIILAMLEETRASVDCAVNGLEAYEAVREAPDAYDLILMDIHMPIMDGLEATEKIREIPDGTAASVPILAVSANCFPADVERCVNSGMNGLIAKPVNFAVMLETMQNFLPPEAGPPETQGMAQE
jgi:CheY-like chemotaxis protein